MRTRALLALAATVVLAPSPAAASEPVRLETPPKIDALKVVDVDGDGAVDVVTLSGRTVCVWTATKDALPAPAPRWKVELPSDVSFVDVARVDRPALLCLGQGATVRVDLQASQTKRLTETGLGWRDGGKAVFADLHPGPATSPTHLVPSATGWRLEPPSQIEVRDIPVPYRREVTAPGPFLEDVATVTSAMPRLSRTTKAAPGPGFVGAVWGLLGNALVELTPTVADPAETRFDLAFLPGTGERRLLDMDGNGTPDLIHRDGDNRETRIAFFRVALLAAGQPAPDLRPPAAYLRLAGFNLDPDYVDLDGDGRVDFVITTMALDGPNIFRAVATGKVTATTLAFLQRKQAPNTPMFPAQPDAVVTSEIGVKIRFKHTGTIDVSRSFTILPGADLDGDGRKDLVIRSGPSTLQIRRGTAEGVWAKDAHSVTIPAVGAGEECEGTAADLDGKPGDEVLLLYRGADTAPDRLYVWKP
jgi:hypothetical protein